MSKQLQISEDLSLPIDAATQTFAFIARKGAGKTYAAGKLTELLMDAGVQCVILDTVGNWYGLRLAADGKGPGFDVPVLGGLRGDVPLEATGGELVADLVVDTGRSVVIDLSQFSLADRKRFATAFAIQLWARKKAQRDPSPVHLVIEESQLIIPENTKGDNARMVGIYEEIIRLGRNYGIGVSMISQRPREILRVLYELGNSQSMTKDEIAIRFVGNSAVGNSLCGGGFNNAISKLRAYELIEGSGQIRASEKFFE
jgi:DNA helicase HerA-like ATPase